MIRTIAHILLLLLACGPKSHQHPNVILIIVDTLRADRLGCYGAREVETPSIDLLSREGVRFENVVTPAPYTLPSVCSILTGLYPYRHQVRDNEMNLHESITTLAEIFREAGYSTAAVLGSAVLSGERNITQEFDHYDDAFPDSTPVFNEKFRKARFGLGARAQRRAVDVTDRALRWLREERGEPFLLLVHYFDPHSLYDPPPPYDSLYKKNPYEGEVAYTDEQIGRLVAGVEEEGLRKNTLVILTADHGEGLGEHGEGEHGFFVYESTIRTPLIFSLPGLLPEGQIIQALARTTDILPTIADLANVGVPEDIDGRTLLPALRGLEYRATHAYSEAFRGYFAYGWSPSRAIRTSDWKYVEAPRRELYNLADDPGELNNLYGQRPGIGKEMEALLQEHLEAERLSEPLPQVIGEVSEEQRERLDALGYLHREGASLADSYAGLPDPKDEIETFNNRQLAKGTANMALPYLESKDYGKAEKLLKEALALDPDYVPALENLARIKLLTARFQEAERLFCQVIELSPENVQYKANLAGALHGQRRLAEAIALLEECVARDPFNTTYFEALEAIRREAAESAR